MITSCSHPQSPNDNKNNIVGTDVNDSLAEIINYNLLKKKSDSTFDTFLKYSADKKTQSQIDSNVFFLDGNAFIEVGGTKLEAEKIKLISQKDYNIVEGLAQKNKKGDYEPRVLLTFDNKKIFADKVRYCVDSARGIADNALYVQDKLIMRAKWLKKDFDDTIYAKNVFLTTCNAMKPHYGFIANKTILKGHKVFIQGANIMFLGVRVPIPFSFIYLLPQERKSGFTYPSGLNWSEQGFYIKDFGYYWYFNDCRDLHITGTFYLGSFSIGMSAKHKYIIRDSYSGSIDFTYNATPLYKRMFFYKQLYRNNWTLSWQHKLLSNKTWDFNIDINLRGESCDDNMYDKNEKEGSSSASIKLSRTKLFKIFSFNVHVNYNKNFKSKIEDLTLPDLSLNTDTISFLKYFSTSVSFQSLAKITNKKVDYEVRDEHDVQMNDDKQVDNLVQSIFDIKNFLNNIIPGFQMNVPINFDTEPLKGIKLRINAGGNAKLYNSIYNNDTKKIEKYWKKWFLIYDFKIGGSLSTTLSSDKISFDEFSKINILHVKEIFHTLSPSLNFSYLPSATDINYTSCYTNVEDKEIDLFAHTPFGNVNNHKSATLSLSANGTINANVNDRGTITKNNLFSYSFSSGYDFINRKHNYWKDIDFSFNTKIYKLSIGYSMSFDLYNYTNIPVVEGANNNNNEKKYTRSADYFWSNLNNTNLIKKLWDKQRLRSGIKISCPLITNKTSNKKEDNIKDLHKESDNNIPDYDPFVFWDKLNTNISYRYDYTFNPIRDTKNITHTVVLDLSSSLSKTWTWSGDIVYDINKNQIKSFSMKISRPLHCWNLSADIGMRRNEKNHLTLSYNMSIQPRDSVLSVLGQQRSDEYDI